MGGTSIEGTKRKSDHSLEGKHENGIWRERLPLRMSVLSLGLGEVVLRDDFPGLPVESQIFRSVNRDEDVTYFGVSCKQ